MIIILAVHPINAPPLSIRMSANKRLFLSIVFLVQAVQIGSGQPSIEDVTFSGSVATLRWETQCNDVEEVTNITYGCSQNKFIESDFKTVRHRINKIEPLRERLLSLSITDSGEWKCVFKLQGVPYQDCTTRDSICVLIDVTSYTMSIDGNNINEHLKPFECHLLM